MITAIKNKIFPLISIVRLSNAVMTAAAVFLGIWLTQSNYITLNTLLLMTAAMCAAAYGNVINDILDIKSDLISHPSRPLVNGTMSVPAAIIFAVLLACGSLISAYQASLFHLKAALIPILALTLYSIYFKRTPIIGNLIIAALVAYALLFGSLPHPQTKILILPALLAFLLNFCREIVKDVEDMGGDKAAGFATTANLPHNVIKMILLVTAVIYAVILLLPSLLLKDFGAVYTVVCMIAVLPLHTLWAGMILRADWKNGAGGVNFNKISKILKFEMLAGLLALTLDKIF
ncbi:MAG: UbiA family prenyltransferase [Chitinispirillia bacterium]|nr:UbiA family prenyltransferase [Chitinispirillia bacterium]